MVVAHHNCDERSQGRESGVFPACFRTGGSLHRPVPCISSTPLPLPDWVITGTFKRSPRLVTILFFFGLFKIQLGIHQGLGQKQFDISCELYTIIHIIQHIKITSNDKYSLKPLISMMTTKTQLK